MLRVVGQGLDNSSVKIDKENEVNKVEKGLIHEFFLQTSIIKRSKDPLTIPLQKVCVSAADYSSKLLIYFCWLHTVKEGENKRDRLVIFPAVEKSEPACHHHTASLGGLVFGLVETRGL